MFKPLTLVITLMSILLMPMAMLYTAWKWALEWIDGATL